MNQDVFLYTVPQWIIFAGVFVSVYGWVENRKIFRLIGISIFFLLGIFSIFILTGDYFVANEYLTPEEIVREEIDEEIINEIPFVAKLFPAYLFFLVSGITSLPSFLLELKDRKYRRILQLITGLISLMGFFIIVGALKSF
jgi:hypothetical protein